jgi:basic membrane protein A
LVLKTIIFVILIISVYPYLEISSSSLQTSTSQSIDQTPDYRVAITIADWIVDNEGNNINLMDINQTISNTTETYNIEIHYINYSSIPELEDLMLQVANQSYDLIISIGFFTVSALNNTARQFPSVKFGYVDDVLLGSNIKSILFKEHESSFLAGVMSALVTQTNKIGYFGGLDNDLFNRFRSGYEQGARYVNPEINVTSMYSPDPDNLWQNFEGGKEVGEIMLEDGIDIIYPAADQTGMGIYEALNESRNQGNQVYGIGVDIDIDFLYPGLILTSAIKQYGTAVKILIEDLVNDTWSNGTLEIGIAEDGVDMSPMKYTQDEAMFSCSENTTRTQFVELLKEEVRTENIVIYPQLLDPSEFNTIPHYCVTTHVQQFTSSTPSAEEGSLISNSRFTLIILFVPILTILLFIFRKLFFPIKSRIVFNLKIRETLSSLFKDHPELVIYIINANLIDDDEVASRFKKEVPRELYRYKFILNPIRLAITKLLFENAELSTIELKNRLGLSWDELNNGIKALKKSNYIEIEKRFYEDRLTQFISLKVNKIDEFRTLSAMLVDFLSDTPNFDLYVERVSSLDLEREMDDLYPD